MANDYPGDVLVRLIAVITAYESNDADSIDVASMARLALPALRGAAQDKADAARFMWAMMDGAFDGLVLDHSGVRDLAALDSLDYARLTREAIDAAMKEKP
jgi:hypothetical protein